MSKGVSHTGSGTRPTLKMLPREVPRPGGGEVPVVREPAKIARRSHFGLSDGAVTCAIDA